MLRLMVLLCAAIFVTLLIAGQDKGQMRPGLAKAVAEGEEIVVLQRRVAAVAPQDPVGEPAVAMLAPAADVVVEAASYVADPPPAEVATRRVVPLPIFTLSNLPTVTVDPVEEAPAAPPSATSAGDVWYVTANTVNVREGPSTDTFVVEKLKRGEAVSVAFEEGSEWARVTIQGDGLEGYVALRFLSPDTP